jgi:protein-S-isoprenylcysteine O-methyltransferase Ste14
MSATRLAPLRGHLLRLPPPRLALGLGGVALAVHLLVWGREAPWGAAPLAGGLISAAGFVWVAWAWALFRAAGTPVRPDGLPLQLIEEGPYRVGRHPMYLGLTTMLLGGAVGLGVPLLALASMSFAALLDAVHIPHEEARLAARFGGWHRDYAQQTRRWL